MSTSLQAAGFVWDSDAEDDEFFDDYVGTSPLIPTSKHYTAKRAKQKGQQGQSQGRQQVKPAAEKGLIKKRNVQYVTSRPKSGPIKRTAVSPVTSSAPPPTRRYDHYSLKLQ